MLRKQAFQVDDLTKGALVVKEDLAKVELYGCMAALKDVRAKCVKMNECIIKAKINTNGMKVSYECKIV